MITEPMLTVEQGLIFLAVLTPFTIYLWTHLGTYKLHIKPRSEGKDTDKLQNPRYGAYIQLAGKKFN
ncbi:hypothetical protein [Streptococcus suis]|uniref:hypothetical protein n=1 Tax=Streptococcus suis TaxID=1307 RepID=UPI00032A4182|nr:hypothetical protein [Streptococcus suis]AGL48249.1 hypothetical protein TL13_1323 [Streptococcus suis TL13]MDS1369183.1 hypothetical protein [Streptococcus suis]QBX11619.1 hypothetical protein JavanS595_0015 [Streptococcus satellite phage Javan595]CYU14119.1 putative phage membrane protein [Streptococcus suis]